MVPEWIVSEMQFLQHDGNARLTGLVKGQQGAMRKRASKSKVFHFFVKQ